MSVEIKQMDDELEKMREDFSQRIKNVSSLKELQDIRVEFLGKKGRVTTLLKKLKEITKEQKPIYGKRINELKSEMEEEIERRRMDIEKLEEKRRFEKEKVDVTLFGARRRVGHRHVVSSVMEEIEEVFLSLGYEIAEGPESETEYNNFDALNTPEWHPARDEHDTFYISRKDGILLRSHTSPVQVRTMLSKSPPIKIIAPGKVYRRDYDATHLPMFHQVEGLLVDKNVSVAHLKATLDFFVKKIFGTEKRTKFVPSFFPFTEPSFEVYVSFGDGWLEILGAGMVDPNVFKEVGYDPEEWTGFAFGMGVERIAMLKYGINDIRMFVRNDIRFIKQF